MRGSSVSPFLLSIFVLSCAPGLNGPLPPPGSIRLAPIAVQTNPATDVSALLDRDTTTDAGLDGPVRKPDP